MDKYRNQVFEIYLDRKKIGIENDLLRPNSTDIITFQKLYYNDVCNNNDMSMPGIVWAPAHFIST